MNHDRDLEICNAATDGPWKCSEVTREGCMVTAGELEVCEVFDELSNGFPDAEFIVHFNPAYVRQLIEKAKERDGLKDFLRIVLNLWLSDADPDELKGIVNDCEELLK